MTARIVTIFQTYVLQYPLRPQWRPYGLDDRCEEVRVNPQTAEVEIDLSIDTDSENYDSGADPRVQMKKQTLATSWKPPPISGCVVGIRSGNKLYFSPIHAVVQLRPSMRHLDNNSKESKRKAATRSNGDVAMKLEEHQEAKPSMTSKKQIKNVEQIKDIAAEWVHLKYNSLRSDMTARCLQKLMEQESSQIYFSMSSHDYLNSLCPGSSSDSFSSKAPPRRSLLALPLKERFQTWLCEGSLVHRFDALKYLAPDESLEEVLAVLQELAHLVQGLWVPKSSLVFRGEGGINVLARDYVLLLFSKDVIIKDSALPKSPPQLNKAMKEVLNVMATERPTFKDWKLKESPDFSFIKNNPSVVKKQEEVWESLEKYIIDNINRGKKGPSTRNPLKSSTTDNPTTSKVSNNQATMTSSGSTKTGMSEEVREATLKTVQRIFKDIKVCSFQQISQQLRDMALEVSGSARSSGFARGAVAAANSIDAFPEELQEIISKVAVNIHGIYVPVSSPDNKKFDEFRKVVIDLFRAEGPNAKLKKATISEAAKLQLQRDVSPIEYNKVLQELCVSQGSSWVLRSADVNPFKPTSS
ncbi:hypothetical protein ACS0TY_026098 [Phlomoides rotata]